MCVCVCVCARVRYSKVVTTVRQCYYYSRALARRSRDNRLAIVVCTHCVEVRGTREGALAYTL